MTYIDDVVESIVRLFDVPINSSMVVNIGNREPVKIADMLHYLSAALGVEPLIKNTKRGDEEPVKTWADTDVIQRLVSYRPHTDIRDGIKEFIEWYMMYVAKSLTPPMIAIFVSTSRVS
jgi:UDP-glucuronate 4-epimerase